MATVIDSLVVQLGLDPSNFNTGQKKAAADFLKTKKEAERQGKEIEEAGKRASEAFYGRLKRESLSFFAALAGAVGLKEFVSQITRADAATGRLAHNLGLSSQTLSSWQMAAQRFGGTAEGLSGSFQSFSSSIQELRTTGNSSILPWMFRLQSLGGRQIDLNKSLDESFLDIGHDIHQISKTNPQLANFLGRQLGLDQGTINLLNRGDDALRKVLQDAKEFAPSREDVAAAKERQSDWNRLSQIFVKLGRTILTDFTPAIDAVLRLLARLGQWLTQFAQNNPRIAEGFTVLLGLFAGAKILTGIRTLIGLKNALLGVAAAETAVTAGATGGGLAALLGKLGAIGLAGYALGKTLEPTAAGGGEDEAARQRGMAARGLDPNGKPLGAKGHWWNGSRYAHAVERLEKEAGLSPLGAKALVARWAFVESPNGPSSVNSSSGAFGIAQWLGNRKNGVAGDTNFDDQLTHAIHELKSTESAAGSALRSASTPEAAARGASMYERAEGYNPATGRDNFTAGIAGRLRNLRASAASRSGTSNSSQTHIGQITVHTQATDASGIARDIGKSLQKFPLAVNANYGPA